MSKSIYYYIHLISLQIFYVYLTTVLWFGATIGPRIAISFLHARCYVTVCPYFHPNLHVRNCLRESVRVEFRSQIHKNSATVQDAARVVSVQSKRFQQCWCCYGSLFKIYLLHSPSILPYYFPPSLYPFYSLIPHLSFSSSLWSLSIDLSLHYLLCFWHFNWDTGTTCFVLDTLIGTRELPGLYGRVNWDTRSACFWTL
jgi:hypothetical protein